MTLKNDAKFEEKMTLGSKNDMRNLVNFNASSGKSGKLQFYVLFLKNCDSLHARLNSHYEAWSYKKKKHNEITVYTKSV